MQRFGYSTLALLLACLWIAPAHGQLELVDQWRITETSPTEGWQSVDFDDSTWTLADGGFGRQGTPGARIGTQWHSNDIWLRKSFQVDAIPDKPALYVHHDDDADVYLNGVQIAALQRWTTDYRLVPLSEEAARALKVGVNTLAVYCHQDAGGQFIDAHIIDEGDIPKLPRPQRNLTPYQSPLTTIWGEQVTAANVWQEYPRPQLVRDAWLNLNGHWDFAITSAATMTVPSEWAGKILVPFAPESKLSGVQRMIDVDEALWYRRTFSLNPQDGKRTLLNFEAVDYRCQVFLNGQKVGEHVGGNNPFSLDATDAIREGENELIVRVEDETEGFQLRGKQVLEPQGIWYTQVTGIWQTVWLEQVPTTSISSLVMTTDARTGTLQLAAEILGDTSAKSLLVRVLDDGVVVAEESGSTAGLTLTIPNPQLWSPGSPHLYRLKILLQAEDGSTLDEIESYTGIRSVGKIRDADGHLRFTLNGKTIFHLGPLDQGWWPDGLLTPPSDEAMLYDIEFLKSAGFNMIRKHIKIEPRRYYYHCDRLGMLVWQDQVSAGRGPPWTRMAPNPEDAVWPEAAHEQFMLELERMIKDLYCHPSIVVWVPFNEAWGQHQTMKVGAWAVERDPTRLINIASGGNFWPIGHIADEHAYPHPTFPLDDQRFNDFIKVVGEYGGHGFPERGHMWEETGAIWGYGNLPKSREELLARYRRSCEILAELKQRGIAGGVYTQTTDVETEVNGLMTYDRKVVKIPVETLRELHTSLIEN
jgi:hypothetical protein